jgi:hypothetical protein
LPPIPRPIVGRIGADDAARSGDARLLVAVLTALFCSLAAVLYVLADGDVSPSVELFFRLGPLLAVILWLQKDAARTGVGAVQDLGFFVWLAWPVVIPWYVFKTRGRAGWALLLGLMAIIGSAYMSAWLLIWVAG